MHPSMNSSDLTVEDLPRDERLATVEIALLSVIFVSATVLNTGLLLLLWAQRKHASRMRVFVLHLCLADLVVALFQVCPQLVWDVTDRFVGPDVLCRLVKYLQLLGMFSSTYMIVAMTVDRYQAICNPMVKFQRGRARLNLPVCLAWGFSLLASSPQLFIFSRIEVAPGVFDCWAHFLQPWGLRAYITWVTLAIFVLPVATIVFCQVRICRAIQANLHHKTHQEGCCKGAAALPVVVVPHRASSVAGMSKARIKTVKMTVVVVFSYVICWGPFFTVQLWSVWDTSAPIETATFVILMLLASLNSCANPCIYLFFSGQMPKKVVAVLCRRQHVKDSSHDDATVVSSLNSC